ncbi:MAG: bifunctional folylpolyglutamate synthase/dihydrofolate synthase [Spirochaetales bacterium]|nr:bifunctional folylpolyglutamate synthase/dihydrofolate synthase [Spirochaetales bacterium]
MEFKTFDQVISYMESFTNLEKRTDKYSNRTYRLDRMHALMETLGHPERCYRTIHVAGSKGKGSTASYIASGLKALGYVTGLYMSPHVSDYRERFTLCGRFVDDSILIETGNELASSLEGFCFTDDIGDSEPTTFELYTAFAFLLFKRLGCQWAVIETGLGGRLDATNILLPEASVITPIELEHTEILGGTIELIATEKSKIIKQYRPSFSAFQSSEALSVIKAEAKAVSSEFHYLGDYVSSVTETSIVFKDGYSASLDLAMKGLVQMQNCALAILVLRNLGLYREGKTEAALESNTLPGRMELVQWKRPLYLDGAHTKNSMDALIKTFRNIYPGRGGVCIFGAVSGKNHLAMAQSVLSAFDTVVISRPGTFKKNDPAALYELVVSLKKPSQTVVLREDASSALAYSLEHCEQDQGILCAGSFYLAGAIKEALCL